MRFAAYFSQILNMNACTKISCTNGIYLKHFAFVFLTMLIYFLNNGYSPSRSNGVTLNKSGLRAITSGTINVL